MFFWQADSSEFPAIGLTSEEKAWLAENNTITLAVDDAYRPKNYRNSAGDITGISIDYLNLIASKTGLKIVFEGDIWAKSLDKALKHKVDGIVNADAIEERMPYLNFTDVYVAYPIALVGKKNFPVIKGLQDLYGKTVAVKKKTSKFALLANKYPNIKTIPVDTVLEGLTLVREGKADAVFDDVSVLQYTIAEKHMADLKVIFLHYDDVVGRCRIGIRKDKPLLRSIINKAIADITEIERLIISRKWADFPIEKESGKIYINLSPEEQKWLDDHPVIRVGAEANWAPVEFTDADGITQGLTSEYLNIIESSLGVKLDIVNDVPWHELMRMARAKEVDMLSGAAITDERKKFLKFTDNYISVPIVIFTNEDVSYIADLSQLNGKKVAVGKDFAPHNLISRDYPDIELVPCDTLQEAIKKLSQREVFALSDAILSVGYYMREMKISGLKIAGKTPYTYNIAMGVRKDWSILADIINRLIESVPQSKKDKFYADWTPITYSHERDIWHGWKIIVPLLLLILLSVFWNRRMLKEIARRKLAENHLAEAKDKVDKINLQLAEKFIERTGEWHETGLALRQKEEMYRQIFEGSNDGIIFCNRLGFFTDANQSFLDMIGYTLEELKKKTYEDITPPQWNKKVKEEILDKYLLVGGKAPRYEKEYIRKDGTAFPVEISAYTYEASDDGTFILWGVVRDISDRKKTEMELKDAVHKLQAMFNQSKSYIGLLSTEGEIIDANDAALAFLNESKENIIGKYVWDPEFWHGSEQAAQEVKESIQAVAHGETIRFQSAQFGKVGSESVTDHSISPIRNEDGDIIYLLPEGRDITELSMAKERAQQQQKKLIQANRLSSLGTMIAGVAHEINNPVNFMAINTELLEQYCAKLDSLLKDEEVEECFGFTKEKFDENMKQVFSAIREGSQRIKKIIYDLKEFSQYESSMSYERFELKETIEKAYNISLGIVKKQVKNVFINIEDKLPVVVGDCLKIEQVIVNMIVNAADAVAGKEDGFLRIDCLSCSENSLRIIIADNGCGISREILQSIFDPFVTTKQEQGGTGLGLSVSYGIIQEHNGSVFVYSQKDKGTCFVIDLPLDRQVLTGEDPKTLLLMLRGEDIADKMLGESKLLKVPDGIDHDDFRKFFKKYAECDVVVLSCKAKKNLESINSVLAAEFPWIKFLCLGESDVCDGNHLVCYSSIDKLAKQVKDIRANQLDGFMR